MKASCIILAALPAMALSARAADTPPADAAQLLESEATQRVEENRPATAEWKPNQIVVGKLTYEGIMVQMVRIDDLFQLFNPAAPPEYGSAEDNVVRDLITGRPSGLKIFSIKF